jgi:hypothetical protein
MQSDQAQTPQQANLEFLRDLLLALDPEDRHQVVARLLPLWPVGSEAHRCLLQVLVTPHTL